jgi:hypothetical protein
MSKELIGHDICLPEPIERDARPSGKGVSAVETPQQAKTKSKRDSSTGGHAKIARRYRVENLVKSMSSLS